MTESELKVREWRGSVEIIGDPQSLLCSDSCWQGGSVGADANVDVADDTMFRFLDILRVPPR